MYVVRCDRVLYSNSVRCSSVQYYLVLGMCIGMLFQKSRWPMHRHSVSSRCPMVSRWYVELYVARRSRTYSICQVLLCMCYLNVYVPYFVLCACCLPPDNSSSRDDFVFSPIIMVLKSFDSPVSNAWHSFTAILDNYFQRFLCG